MRRYLVESGLREHHIGEILPPVHRDHPLVAAPAAANVHDQRVASDELLERKQALHRETAVGEEVRGDNHLFGAFIQPPHRILAVDAATDMQPVRPCRHRLGRRRVVARPELDYMPAAQLVRTV